MNTLSETYLVDHYSSLGSFKRDFRNNNLFQLIAGMVRGERIVDVGSGAGHFSGLLLEKGKNVVGIEPNAGLVELSRRTHPGLSVIPGTAEEIDTLLSSPVDTVCMLDVLEHIEKDEEQVKKIHTVLEPGGQFIVVVPAYPSLYGIRDQRMGHFRRYTTMSLAAVLQANGFKVVRMRYWNAVGVVPYVIAEKIFKRPLRVKLREEGNVGVIKRFMHRLIDLWMREVENRFDFGFGLSIICIAQK